MLEQIVIKHEALKLPAKDRAVLTDRLIDSLSENNASIEKSWVEECDSRVEALKNGELSVLDGKTALDTIRAKIA